MEFLDKTILFDVGKYSEILLHNFSRLDLDPHEIDIVVLSHSDDDHRGALFGFLEVNPKVELYLLDDYQEDFYKKASSFGTKVRVIHDFSEIIPGVFTTGELPAKAETGVLPKKEQSLIFTSPKGNVLLTGCCHMGLIPLTLKHYKHFGKDILLILGGLHLLDASEKSIRDTLLALRVHRLKNLAPTHCSGTLISEVFKEVFGVKPIDFGLGKKLNIEDLSEVFN
jgi:7,8-dihydropterin-6-yl-methyl-4-(beta-D-ribofuranosyl)aminobenzene 5'-phosphate synthase